MLRMRPALVRGTLPMVSAPTAVVGRRELIVLGTGFDPILNICYTVGADLMSILRHCQFSRLWVFNYVDNSAAVGRSRDDDRPVGCSPHDALVGVESQIRLCSLRPVTLHAKIFEDWLYVLRVAGPLNQLEFGFYGYVRLRW